MAGRHRGPRACAQCELYAPLTARARSLSRQIVTLPSTEDASPARQMKRALGRIRGRRTRWRDAPAASHGDAVDREAAREDRRGGQEAESGERHKRPRYLKSVARPEPPSALSSALVDAAPAKREEHRPAAPSKPERGARGCEHVVAAPCREPTCAKQWHMAAATGQTRLSSTFRCHRTVTA